MFNTGELKQKVPKQITFGEGGTVVVVGSDDAKAYVFERGGNPDQVLDHAKEGYAQTIAVRDLVDFRCSVTDVEI